MDMNGDNDLNEAIPPVEVEDEFMEDQVDVGNKNDIDKLIEQELDDIAAEQLIRGAQREQEANDDRDKLIETNNELELRVKQLMDDREKLQRERAEAYSEIEALKKQQFTIETKARNAKKMHAASDAAITEGFHERDLAGARSWRSSKPIVDLRIPVDGTSPIHPDYACEQCGQRELGSFFKEDSKGTHVAHLMFRTLRELGALVDLKDEWRSLSVWEARQKMVKASESKSVSSNSLKLAYCRALCVHAVTEAERANRGLFIEDEERISEALSEVIASKTERLIRKNCVVLIPGDSCIQKAKGPFREIDQMPYKDETELKKHLQDMIDADSFPRSLVIILKSSFTTSNLVDIQKDAKKIIKKFETTIYIAADLLSTKPSDVESDSIKGIQEWLTKWKLEKPPVNLIVISPISGLLWSHHPMSTLFVLMRKESKDAFEAAIKFIVDGVPIPSRFSVDPVPERLIAQARRSYGGGRGGKRSSSTPSSDDPCHYCQDTGHFKWNCPNKKKSVFE